jgi:hypothetical protein
MIELHPDNTNTSALEMERECFPKMMASTNQSTQLLNPKYHHNHHYHENLKSHNYEDVCWDIAPHSLVKVTNTTLIMKAVSIHKTSTVTTLHVT